MDKKYNLYIDDIKTPTADEWVVIRSYKEFKSKVIELGLDNIGYISFGHDLGETAIKEYNDNVSPNYTLNYSNIKEPTGFNCVKWLIDHFYEMHKGYKEENASDKTRSLYFPFPHVYVHSDNPIGAGNIIGYVNNFLMNEKQPKDCVSVSVEYV